MGCCTCSCPQGQPASAPWAALSQWACWLGALHLLHQLVKLLVVEKDLHLRAWNANVSLLDMCIEAVSANVTCFLYNFVSVRVIWLCGTMCNSPSRPHWQSCQHIAAETHASDLETCILLEWCHLEGMQCLLVWKWRCTHSHSIFSCAFTLEAYIDEAEKYSSEMRPS